MCKTCLETQETADPPEVTQPVSDSLVVETEITPAYPVSDSLVLETEIVAPPPPSPLELLQAIIPHLMSAVLLIALILYIGNTILEAIKEEHGG